MKYLDLPIAPGRVRNRRLKDYAGCRFGRLVGVALVQRDVDAANHLWRFACDCGGEHVTGIKNVRTGKTTSCGCAFREMLVARNSTHGLSRANRPEYRSWKDMRSRCGTPTDSDFKDYGGRGIAVCDRWADFGAFLADMGKRPDGRTLDRIDVNGNYEPSNCRWASAETQANNKRTNWPVEYDGRVQNVTQWCRELGLDRTKVSYRLKIGMSVADAFSNKDFRIVDPEDCHR